MNDDKKRDQILCLLRLIEFCDARYVAIVATLTGDEIDRSRRRPSKATSDTAVVQDVYGLESPRRESFWM